MIATKHCFHLLSQIRSTWLLSFTFCAALFVFPVEGRGGVLVLRYNGVDICHSELVSPRLATTAFHCVEGLSPDSLTLVSTDGSNINTEIISIKAISAKGRAQEGYEPQHDLALIAFRNSIGSPVLDVTDFNGTPPAKIIRMRQYNLNGKTLYKIEHLNIQSWTIDGLLLFVRPVMCEGDSGAPVLDAHGKLVAIVVGVTSSDCIGGMTVLATFPQSMVINGFPH